MKISIVIPYYNHWDLTHQRMMDIYKFAPDDCEIILVNDASPDLDCRKGVTFWQKQVKRHEIKYIENKENVGFGRSMNRGASIATGEVLVLLSNDVVIRNDVFTQIVNKILEYQGNCLIGGRVIFWPGGWNEFRFEDKPFVIPYCEGWLLAMNREVWDNLGGFDKRYGRYDYEDVDLSTQAIVKGYELLGLNSAYVYHLGGQTIDNKDRMKVTERNREIFIEKWSPQFNLIVNGLERRNGKQRTD